MREELLHVPGLANLGAWRLPSGGPAAMREELLHVPGLANFGAWRLPFREGPAPQIVRVQVRLQDALVVSAKRKRPNLPGQMVSSRMRRSGLTVRR